MDTSRISLSLRTADLATAVSIGLLGAAILVLIPSQIRGETLAALADVRSPAFFACLCGVALLVLSAALALRASFAAGGDRDEKIAVEDPGRVLVALLVLTAATGAIFVVGLLVAGALAMVALALVFGYRRWPVLAIAVVATPILVHVLFERILLVLLPRGLL